jgi:FkbM family methyltransferase
MNNAITAFLCSLEEELPSLYRGTTTYAEYEERGKAIFSESVLSSATEAPVDFGDFGEIIFPHQQMGAISSLDLFGLDELIIFHFYKTRRLRYSRTADIGANIGLHSIMMGRNGWTVDSFEPDPFHCELFEKRMRLNNVPNINLRKCAVSNFSGKAEFVRVEGNSTGSHIAGSKDNPYGELTRYSVNVLDIGSIVDNYEFIKLDVEGAEVDVLSGIEKSQWDTTDMMLEIGTEKAAEEIFALAERNGLTVYSQKKGWKQVETRDDLPTSHREGSAFISQHGGPFDFS